MNKKKIQTGRIRSFLIRSEPLNEEMLFDILYGVLDAEIQYVGAKFRRKRLD